MRSLSPAVRPAGLPALVCTLVVLSLVAVLAGCGAEEGNGGIPTQTVQPPDGTISPTASPTQTGSPSPTQEPTESPAATGSPSPTATGGGEGEQVFAANCTACHGQNGAGGVGPDVRPLTEGDLNLIRTTVTNGRGQMPAFRDQLSEQQIDDVAEYVAGLE